MGTRTHIHTHAQAGDMIVLQLVSYYSTDLQVLVTNRKGRDKEDCYQVNVEPNNAGF